jgi:membrane peptidoglycan carboxypeptidase
MARAYATIANDGLRVDGSLTGDRPRVIERVGSRRGDKVRVNTPVAEKALDEGQARLLTTILQGVVRSGTGRRAAIPGVPIAGKTGTTDNYGDAWFVGYTPELVTAVWVGYPNELRPMLTEFHGRPVAGGTLPAQIWKEFMQRERETESNPASYFPAPPYLGSQDYRIVKRDGWKLDNGYCPGTRLVSFFSGLAPSDQAECFPNEVSVPDVTGLNISAARERLALQPLGVEPIGIPARAGSRPGLVTRQDPAVGGFASAASSIRVWVTRPDPRYGLFPNLVGSSLADASTRLKKLKVTPRVSYARGSTGVILEQKPAPGVAAGPRMRVLLVVGR